MKNVRQTHYEEIQHWIVELEARYGPIVNVERVISEAFESAPDEQTLDQSEQDNA